MMRPRPGKWVVCLLGVWLGVLQPWAKPFMLCVAPNGNDAQPGTLTKPLATLEAALAQAREAKRVRPAAVRDGVTILLRGGTYELSRPIVLTPADSGAGAKAALTIAAYPHENPVLSGGRRITGWVRVPGKAGVWEARVPEMGGSNWYFRSLFVNGARRQRARTPNEGFFRIEGAVQQEKPAKLRFRAGDIKKEWADAGDVEVVALLAWSEIRMYLRQVDEASHLATLSTNPRPSNQENNARYYIENAPDGLDAPGEWQLKSNLVRYQAAPGEDLTSAEVVGGFLRELIIFQGDVARQDPVRHVHLRGLSLSYTDWDLPPEGYADTQAAVAVRGDVRAEGAADCAVEDCTFAHLGGYALDLGRGCQRWKVSGNEMRDLGAGGVRVGEPGKRNEPVEANHGHVIADNEIHHGGIIYPSAVGVLILQSGTNRVAHNHIHHLYYTAVSVGWNWGYQETPCRQNLIEFNHLHDIGQSMLSDMGAVYTLGIQAGTVVRNNLIHDVTTFTYGGWGLYPDEGSTGIVFESNLVYRCQSASFHQHYGRENIVRNNILAFGREYQLMRTREEDHLSFIFTNNIVYFDSGALLGSNWKNDRFIIDRNLYFDARTGSDPAGLRFAGATWQEWRARGHDLHSLIADPLFAATNRFDFRLQPNSPALRLGFKPIVLDTVGVRPRDRRK